MKNTKPLTWLFVFVLFAASCKRTPEAAIAGRWEEINGSDRVEFQPNGIFGANMKYGPSGGQRDLAGKYFVSGDSISIDLGDNSAMTWKFQQSDDRLVVTFTAGGNVKMDSGIKQFRHAK